MRVLKKRTLMIDVDDLNICESYQRTVRPACVNRIVRHFDSDALGTLCVGQRNDGSLWIVDGQQRWTALKKMGVKRAPCDVFVSSGKSHEARIFRHKNKDRTGVNGVTIFKALLTEENEDAISIQATVESAGFRLVLNSGRNSGGWPGLVCVGALNNIYDRGGARHLSEVLSIIFDTWEGEDDATRGALIDGMSVLLHRLPELDRTRLVSKLKVKTPQAILRAQEAYKAMGGGRAVAVAHAILGFYNKGSRKKLQLAS